MLKTGIAINVRHVNRDASQTEWSCRFGIGPRAKGTTQVQPLLLDFHFRSTFARKNSMRSPYEVFLRIVEAGSISKACAVLNITQPALSRQVKKLEHELGVSLFERTATGMTLTVYGEALIGYARSVVQAQASAMLDIGRLKQSFRGQVTFGVSVPSNLLPVATINAISRNPDLRLTIVEKPPQQLLSMVRKRELEFALCTSSLVDSDDKALTSRKLFIDQRIVVAAARHPLFMRGADQLAELLKDLWILPPAGFIRDWLTERFAEIGLSAPIAKVETTSIIQTINAIESGRFISVLPATAIRRQLEQGMFRPVLPEHFSKTVDIVAVSNAKRPPNRAAKHLLDSIAAGEEGMPIKRSGLQS